MHEIFENLREKGKRDLKKLIEKSDLSPAEWTNAKTVLSALCKMDELEKNSEYGESYGMSYDSNSNDISSRRGRSARTGRYISMDRSPYYDSYSMDRGMSGHSITDRMVDQIERMYDMAKTDHERRELEKWITRIQNGD